MGKNLISGILMIAVIICTIFLFMTRQKLKAASKEVSMLRAKYMELEKESVQERKHHIDLYRDCAREKKDLQELLKNCEDIRGSSK